jgi:hypothetical protein
VSEDFPLNSSQTSDLREMIANKIMAVHDIEFDAIQVLQAVVE